MRRPKSLPPIASEEEMVAVTVLLGLAAPHDVSLISLDNHPAFEWFEPEVSHIATDTRRWVPRVVRWADNVANGRQDRRETLILGKFVEGGTIGPAAASGNPVRA